MHTHVVESPCQCELRNFKLDKAPATDSRSRYDKFITCKARPHVGIESIVTRLTVNQADYLLRE